MGALRSFIARKGPFFLINNLVLGTLAVWLVYKIAQSGFAAEKLYANVRLIALGCVAILASLSFPLGRRGNARLLVGFAATCVAGEILLRTMGTVGAGVQNDVPWREPRPYFMFGGRSDGRPVTLPLGTDVGTVRLNGEGFRIEREIVNPKPVDEFRIFVLGGSTVVVGKVPLPTLIETHLRANGMPQARVYNFGVVSFVSGQELSLLVHRLVDLSPDLVIAYDGGNDLFQPWGYDPRPGYPFNYVTEEEAMTAFRNAWGAAKTIESLGRDSALLQALQGTGDASARVWKRVDDLRSEVKIGSTQWKQAAVNAYVRNLAAMCRVSRAYHALFASYFQPILPYSKALDSRQTAMSGGDTGIQGLRDQRVMTLQAFATQLPAPPAEPGCRFTDLSGILENEPAAFDDIIHVDVKPNQLIGQRIAEDILSWSAARSGSGAR